MSEATDQDTTVVPIADLLPYHVPSVSQSQVLAYFFEKGRCKSRKTSHWSLRRSSTPGGCRGSFCWVSNTAKGRRGVIHSILMHFAQAAVCSNHKTLKRLGIGQSLYENLVGKVIGELLHKRTHSTSLLLSPLGCFGSTGLVLGRVLSALECITQVSNSRRIDPRSLNGKGCDEVVNSAGCCWS
jgi:hypothetical protein